MKNTLLRSQLIEKMVEHLPAFRALLNMTQEKLAEAIGIGRQTYMLIESGKAKMRWDTFVTLSALFSSNEETKNLAIMLHLDIDSITKVMQDESSESIGDKNFANAQKMLNEYNTSMAAIYFESAGEQYLKEGRISDAIEAYEKAVYCLDIDHDVHSNEVRAIISSIKA